MSARTTPGEAAHVCAQEGHREAAADKHFVEALEVCVIWFVYDWVEHISLAVAKAAVVLMRSDIIFWGGGARCGCLQSFFL